MSGAKIEAGKSSIFRWENNRNFQNLFESGAGRATRAHRVHSEVLQCARQLVDRSKWPGSPIHKPADRGGWNDNERNRLGCKIYIPPAEAHSDGLT